MGLAGGINTYAYVRGNPINSTDPWGLCDCVIDPQRMADYLRGHASQAPGGYCARAVSHAVDAAGGNSGYATNTSPAAGKDAGAMLTNNGFTPVSSENYTPQVGDTRVFGATPGHPYEHVQTYTTYTDSNGKVRGQWFLITCSEAIRHLLMLMLLPRLTGRVRVASSIKLGLHTSFQIDEVMG